MRNGMGSRRLLPGFAFIRVRGSARYVGDYIMGVGARSGGFPVGSWNLLFN